MRRRKSPPIRFNDRQPDEWRMLCYTWRSLKLNETFFRPAAVKRTSVMEIKMSMEKEGRRYNCILLSHRFG